MYFNLFINHPEKYYYAQIDDTKISQINTEDNKKYEYHLKINNAKGFPKKIKK